jgi:hypothetical protein
MRFNFSFLKFFVSCLLIMKVASQNFCIAADMESPEKTGQGQLVHRTAHPVTPIQGAIGDAIEQIPAVAAVVGTAMVAGQVATQPAIRVYRQNGERLGDFSNCCCCYITTAVGIVICFCSYFYLEYLKYSVPVRYW